MTEKFKITQLTPELRRLLEIIKAGRDHTAELIMLVDMLDPVDRKTVENNMTAAYTAGIFGTIGNVVNAITSEMDETTQKEAIAIVYGTEEKSEEYAKTDLSIGQAALTHLLVRALKKGLNNGTVEMASGKDPEIKKILDQLKDLSDSEKPATVQEFVDRIPDKDFADAEMVIGGYAGPVKKEERGN